MKLYIYSNRHIKHQVIDIEKNDNYTFIKGDIKDEVFINQVSTISVPQPRLINLTPNEKPLLPLIEKSIIDANMGFTPGNDGSSVLVPIPPLSEERRVELNKFVHKLVEDGRVAIRNVRRDGIQNLHNFEKEGHVSEDVIKDNELEIQKITDGMIKKLNELQEEKEKEILEV